MPFGIDCPALATIYLTAVQAIPAIAHVLLHFGKEAMVTSDAKAGALSIDAFELATKQRPVAVMEILHVQGNPGMDHFVGEGS
jgi:hypothetical protein